MPTSNQSTNCLNLVPSDILLVGVTTEPMCAAKVVVVIASGPMLSQSGAKRIGGNGIDLNAKFRMVTRCGPPGANSTDAEHSSQIATLETGMFIEMILYLFKWFYKTFLVYLYQSENSLL